MEQNWKHFKVTLYDNNVMMAFEIKKKISFSMHSIQIIIIIIINRVYIIEMDLFNKGKNELFFVQYKT